MNNIAAFLLTFMLLLTTLSSGTAAGSTMATLPVGFSAADTGKAENAPLIQRNLRFAHVNAAQGLSQDSVMAVVQDQQGFIWIATQDGLNRYNGHEIKLFERDPFDATSLSNNWIFALALAADGKLWIATDGGGINIYDPITEKFSTIRHNPDDPNSISSDRVRTLHQDQQGNMWIGTVKAGLNRIDANTLKVHHYTHDAGDNSSLPANAVLTINEDLRGRLWVGTDGGGLARFDRANNSFVSYQSSDNPQSLGGDRVSAIFEDRDGWLWVGTRDGGVSLLNPDTDLFQRFTHDPEDPKSLSSNFVRAIMEDQDGTLWIATDKGLNEWRPNANGFAHYFAEDSDPTSLGTSRLSTLFQSSDGVLWVGSYAGVNTWNYLSDAFTHFRKDEGRLGADIVTAISEDSAGHLWIGTYGGGLTAIDRATASTLMLKNDPQDEQSLSDDRVMALFIDPKDVVWAGTRSNGLNRYDIKTGKLQRISKPQLSSNRISSLYGDPDGTMWIGTFGGGLHRMDPNGDITLFKHDENNPDSIGGNRILAITRDKQNTLWVGTERGGLNRLVEPEGIFEQLTHDPNNQNSLSSSAAWEVYESSDGSLWIATMNDGLNQWRAADRAAGREIFVKWNKADGLRSNTIYGLLEDDAGHLWMSSNRGISRINVQDKEIRHYDRRNGLIGDEFNLGARFRSRTGQLLFGGSEGAVAFVPGKIRRSETIPPIVLSAYSPLQRLGVRYSGTPDKNPVTISHTDNYIALEFAALDYTSPDKNDYRYQLEGFDTEWQNPQAMRRITYANLSPGTYTFRVKAANNDDIWNEQGAQLAVVVQPPPWRSNWAYACYALLFALLLYLAYQQVRARRAREAQQRELLESQVAERTSQLGERNRQLEDLNDKLLQASYTDSLTGLYNRRYLNQFIEQQISTLDRESHAKRQSPDADYSHYQQSVMFFMMIDLDGFKSINDNYGHAAGDKALLQVRDALLDCTRKSDTVIRWGGDEFLITGQTLGLAGIANFAERVRLAIAEHVYDIGNGQTARLACSVGAVPYPLAPLKTNLLTWEQSLNVADAGAYIVKSNGRNGWFVLNGKPEITPEEAALLPGALEELVAAGKLQYSTCLPEPVALASKQQSVA